MPRKKNGRVKTPNKPALAMRLPAVNAKPNVAMPKVTPASATPNRTITDPVDVTPAQNLFWACYRAGVDTMRLAFEMQSAFVKQSFQVAPASLALQCQVACFAFTTEHDRVLDWGRGSTHPA